MELTPPRINQKSKSKVAALCLGVAVFAASSAANGYAIIIEPDHYAEGTNLSTIAPYVTLQNLDGFGGGGSVSATKPVFDFASPTGELGFGSYGAGWVQCEGHFDCATGFAMTFHQPVDWVSLKAINGIYGYLAEEDGGSGSGLSAAWLAFDVNGDYLASGGDSGVPGDNRGIVFEMHWAIPGMTSLVVGGDTSISAFEFDDLRFKLTQTTVPEPGTLGLFGMGLAVLVASRRRQRHPPGLRPPTLHTWRAATEADTSGAALNT